MCRWERFLSGGNSVRSPISRHAEWCADELAAYWTQQRNWLTASTHTERRPDLNTLPPPPLRAYWLLLSASNSFFHTELSNFRGVVKKNAKKRRFPANNIRTGNNCNTSLSPQIRLPKNEKSRWKIRWDKKNTPSLWTSNIKNSTTLGGTKCGFWEDGCKMLIVHSDYHKQVWMHTYGEWSV